MDGHALDSPEKCPDDRPLRSSEQCHDDQVAGEHDMQPFTLPPDQSVHSSETVQQKLRKRRLLLLSLVSIILGVGLAMALALFYMQPDPKTETLPVDTPRDSTEPVPLTQTIRQRVVSVLPVAALASLRTWWPALVAGLVALAAVVACSCLIYYLLETTAATPDPEVPVDPNPLVPDEDPVPVVEDDADEGLSATWITFIAVGCGLVVVVCVGAVIKAKGRCPLPGCNPSRSNPRDTLHPLGRPLDQSKSLTESGDDSLVPARPSDHIEYPHQLPSGNNTPPTTDHTEFIAVPSDVPAQESLPEDILYHSGTDTPLKELGTLYKMEMMNPWERSNGNLTRLKYFDGEEAKELDMHVPEEELTILTACKLLNNDSTMSDPFILVPINSETETVVPEPSPNFLRYELWMLSEFMANIKDEDASRKWLNHVLHNSAKLNLRAPSAKPTVFEGFANVFRDAAKGVADAPALTAAIGGLENAVTGATDVLKSGFEWFRQQHGNT